MKTIISSVLAASLALVAVNGFAVGQTNGEVTPDSSGKPSMSGHHSTHHNMMKHEMKKENPSS